MLGRLQARYGAKPSSCILDPTLKRQLGRLKHYIRASYAKSTPVTPATTVAPLFRVPSLLRKEVHCRRKGRVDSSDMPCRATRCVLGIQMRLRHSHRQGGALMQMLTRTWHGPLLPAWKRQVCT